MDTQQITFSIIVNTYKRAHSLEATLQALAALRWSSFEIIVVTGPSEDNTIALMQTWTGRVKHLVCPSVNLSQSRNIGLAHASGDWIAFTDDDALPEPDWLCQLAAHIVAHQHVKLGAVGGFVYDHSGHDYQAQYLMSDLFGNTKFHSLSVSQYPSATQSTSEYYPSLMGVNVCYARRALQQVGGFDNAYAYFLEETDLVLRLVQQGWQVHCVPLARVHHKYADSHIRHNKTISSFYHIMRSRAYFSVRHALPVWGLQALATQHARWLDDVRQHHSQLTSEAYYGLNDGVKMAQQVADIPYLAAQSLSSWKAFKLDMVASQRLRLLLVSADFPPVRQGGVARFMHALAAALAAQGHEVSVISQADVDMPSTVDRVDGYWLHRIQPLSDAQMDQLPFLEGLPQIPQPMKGFSAAVWQEVVRIQPNRQFQAALGSLWNVETAFLLASRMLPMFTYLVTSYHHMQWHNLEWQDEPFNTQVLQPMLLAEKWLLQHSNLIASSRAIVRDTLSDTGVNQVAFAKVVPFGLPDLSVKSPEVSDKASITLLYVGRFEHRKGIDLLLQILPKLLAQYPALTIECIGNHRLPWGADPPIKETFCLSNDDTLNRILFLDEVSDERLLQAYQSCDIFIAPSRYESFGLIYVEAMRTGKPSIGTWAGGIPEVLSDQETGLLAQPDDAQSLYQCIVRLIEAPELRDKMGIAARQRYESQFSALAFARNIVQHLQQTLCSAV